MELIEDALCTLEDLKDFMGIDASDENVIRDKNLTLYINALSTQVNKKLGRSLLAKDYVEKYQGTDTTELVLNNYPINSIDSVDYVLDGEVYMTLDDYEYDLDEESGILTKDDGWLLQGYSMKYMSDKIDFPRRHIRVNYNAGYTEIPFDLQLLCMQYIRNSYDMDNSKGRTLKSYGISDVKLEYRDEIKFNAEQNKIINSYVRRSLF